jgi:hypothetical protein
MKGPSFMDASERCMQLPFVEAVRRLASPARVVEVVITVAVAAAEVTQVGGWTSPGHPGMGNFEKGRGMHIGAPQLLQDACLVGAGGDLASEILDGHEDYEDDGSSDSRNSG